MLVTSEQLSNSAPSFKARGVELAGRGVNLQHVYFRFQDPDGNPQSGLSNIARGAAHWNREKAALQARLGWRNGIRQLRQWLALIHLKEGLGLCPECDSSLEEMTNRAVESWVG